LIVVLLNKKERVCVFCVSENVRIWKRENERLKWDRKWMIWERTYFDIWIHKWNKVNRSIDYRDSKKIRVSVRVRVRGVGEDVYRGARKFSVMIEQNHANVITFLSDSKQSEKKSKKKRVRLVLYSYRSSSNESVWIWLLSRSIL
jgi:hypothetical protein